jgi:hypothetical protein
MNLLLHHGDPSLVICSNAGHLVDPLSGEYRRRLVFALH